MIALLLRLYPVRWRARYGDEFAAVLEDRPLGPFDVADVLLGALDAHLHLRGLGAASQHAKGFAMSLRIGGYAAILAGILWFVILAANAINAGSEAGVPWIGPFLVALVVANLIALAGLSAFQARQYPALTWAAFVVPAIGAVMALLAMVAITVNGSTDRVLVAGLSGWALGTLGFLMLLVGSVLFGLATWRARSLSRAAAGLLVAGAVTTFATLAGLAGGGSPEALRPILIVLMILVFPAGWVAMGISALRVGQPAMPTGGAAV